MSPGLICLTNQHFNLICERNISKIDGERVANILQYQLFLRKPGLEVIIFLVNIKF
jgi:hypothetical protein